MLQKSLLEKFDVTLRKNNRINYDRLQPPLSEREIDSYLAGFGLENDKDLKTLFSWKNGFDFSKAWDLSYKIFEFGALMSLEHIQNYFSYQTQPEYNVDGEKIFLPLVITGSGDTLLYNIEKERYGKIYLYSVALLFIEEPISYHDSLSSMIETTIQAYEEKILEYDKKEDWLEVHSDRFYSLAKRLNKKSEYWKQV